MSSSMERIKQRAAKAEEKKNISFTPVIECSNSTPLQLPLELLGQGARGAPDSILRSALFSATKPGPRRQLDNEEVASVANVTIRQTGPQLQQGDLDVWIELVRLAAETQNSYINLPLKTLLTRLNRDKGSQSKERLLSTLLRLNACLVSITYTINKAEKNYNGNMIFEHSRDEKQHLVIRLNPRIAALFDKSSWSTLQLEQRRKLKRNPLAQWLHGYYSSHTRPFPIKIETLRQLSGSQAQSLFHYRDRLRDAMEKVQGATGWGWQIKEDKLIVVKGGVTSDGIE